MLPGENSPLAPLAAPSAALFAIALFAACLLTADIPKFAAVDFAKLPTPGIDPMPKARAPSFTASSISPPLANRPSPAPTAAAPRSRSAAAASILAPTAAAPRSYSAPAAPPLAPAAAC